MSITDFRSDSAIYKFTVKLNNIAQDITGWKIVCEIWDEENSIKKATANVVGGGDDQIQITDAANGKFEIYIDKNETSNFTNVSNIEIASFVGDNKDTIYRNTLKLKTERITWETP